MFSGEQRYLHKSLAKKITDIPEMPVPIEIRRKAFKEIGNIERRSMNEATAVYPNDLNKQIDFMRILDDRYKLLLFHKYGIPVGRYHELVVEGVKNGWR